MTEANGHAFFVSSELNAPEDGSIGKYSGLNLFDQNPATAWVEGADGKGSGEYVITGPYTSIPEEVIIENGYQKSPELFQANNRLQSAFLTLMIGIHIPGHETELGPEVYLLPVPGNRTLQFQDSLMTSEFSTGWTADIAETFKKMAVEAFLKEQGGLAGDKDNKAAYYIRLEIKCVYPGSKWDDTCISGLEVLSPRSGKKGLQPGEHVVDVFVTEDGRQVLVNTDRRKGLVLADASSIAEAEDVPAEQRGTLVLMVMDTSPNKEWAQVDVIYGHPEPGRAEEVARLFNVRLMKAVDPLLIGEDIYTYYGFIVKDGKTYLDTDAGEIDLDEVFKKLEPSYEEN